MTDRPEAISKVLSPNEAGETGGHQAGMLISKAGDVLRFFPPLDDSRKNPRVFLDFTDGDGEVWKLCFIHYNNRSFGGTRDEYRLTGLTRYFRRNGLKSGDTVTLRRLPDGTHVIRFRRRRQHAVTTEDAGDGRIVRTLHVGTGWRVIDI